MLLKALALALTFLPSLPLTVLAAEMPKEGTDTHTNAWVVQSFNMVKLGDRSYTTYELTGVSRNESGGAIFDNMAMHALGVSETIGDATHGEGVTIYTDKDGDQIFEQYNDNGGGSGDASLIGGTGKFAGISGTDEYSGTLLFASDDKRVRGVVTHHKTHWLIK